MAIVQCCLIKQAEGAEGTRWRSAWSKDPNSRPSFYVICEELMLLKCSQGTGMFAFFALHQVVGHPHRQHPFNTFRPIMVLANYSAHQKYATMLSKPFCLQPKSQPCD